MANQTPDYPLILDCITEGVFTVDAEFRITYLNAAAESITGIDRDQAIGHKCHEVLRATICQSGCALRRSVDTGKPQNNVQATILNADMESIPLCVSTSALRGRDGELLGGVETFRDISEIETLRSELSGRRVFGDIIGASPAMQEIFQIVPDIAKTSASVLIEGASGTGKELVAQAIHDLSPRSDSAFIGVNCAALPDTLLESELFGYVRGAFTDAHHDKPGCFQAAHGGTLFLDEIGDISPAMQVKLLRVLQNGEFQPLGGTRTKHVDVRVIAATNRDLKQMVAAGEFREDLYYRLRVIPIVIPPLAERREDIIPLVEHYVARLAARTGKPISEVTASALAALYDYTFPGNVRELINILERAFVMCHGDRIDLAHIPAEVTAPAPYPLPATSTEPLLRGGHSGGKPGPSRRLGHLKPSERRLLRTHPEAGAATMAAISRPEVRFLVEALEANDWNRSATALALGIARSTLWRRMKEYELL